MRPGKRKQQKLWGQLTEKVEKLKSNICAKVQHLFQVIKRQLSYIKVRYRGLKKKTRRS